MNDVDFGALMQQFERAGFVLLPPLSEAETARVEEAVDEVWHQQTSGDTTASLKLDNAVVHHQAFLDIIVDPLILEAVVQHFGYGAQLHQFNVTVRPYRAEDAATTFTDGIDWHADGPRPRQFPLSNNQFALYYLKVGLFLSDLTHGNGGALQVIPGSHRLPELCKDKTYDLSQHEIITLDVPAGSRVLFHQALWHAAFPNRSTVTRKAIYYSYSPFWLRPIDRDGYDEAIMRGKNVTPLMRQLLSDFARPLDFWLPKIDDLPLKHWHDVQRAELATA
jgi:hypothetical protein